MRQVLPLLHVTLYIAAPLAERPSSSMRDTPAMTGCANNDVARAAIAIFRIILISIVCCELNQTRLKKPSHCKKSKILNHVQGLYTAL